MSAYLRVDVLSLEMHEEVIPSQINAHLSSYAGGTYINPGFEMISFIF